MGINFIKQYVGAGLAKDTTLLLLGFSADQHVINPVGGAMAGLFNTAHWSPDFTNAANVTVVAEFEKEYQRVPTLDGSQGHDAALLIAAAVRDTKGNLDDQGAVQKALKAAKFESVRGPFRFNTNPVPDPELLRAHCRHRRPWRADQQVVQRADPEESRRRVHAELRDDVIGMRPHPDPHQSAGEGL